MQAILAFDKSTGKFLSGEWFNSKIISLFTFSRYNHIEIIIGNKWISSSASQGGVKIHDLRPLKDKFDYIPVEFDGRKYKTIMKFIKEQENKEYDLWGAIIGGGFDEDVNSKDKWFCSELVSEILKRMEIPGFEKVQPARMSPADVYEYITQYRCFLAKEELKKVSSDLIKN